MVMTYILTLLFAVPLGLMVWLLLAAMLYEFFNETTFGRRFFK